MITTGLFTSNADDWATPKALFAELNAEFSFTLDVCANNLNHKVDNYFDKEIDGLQQNWLGHICWMNPPYGKAIKAWMAKAHETWLQGGTVVCLVPARTDTAWWHDYAMKAPEIRFLRGRIKFEKPNTKSDPAPFPSAIVIFRQS